MERIQTFIVGKVGGVGGVGHVETYTRSYALVHFRISGFMFLLFSIICFWIFLSWMFNVLGRCLDSLTLLKHLFINLRWFSSISMYFYFFHFFDFWIQFELFISKDDSPKHNREITLAKRLFKAIEISYGTNKGFSFHRPSRQIKFKGRNVAKVECKSFEEFDVLWMPANIEASKITIDKKAILDDFNTRVGLAPSHAWCI